MIKIKNRKCREDYSLKANTFQMLPYQSYYVLVRFAEHSFDFTVGFCLDMGLPLRRRGHIFLFMLKLWRTAISLHRSFYRSTGLFSRWRVQAAVLRISLRFQAAIGPPSWIGFVPSRPSQKKLNNFWIVRPFPRSNTDGRQLSNVQVRDVTQVWIPLFCSSSKKSMRSQLNLNYLHIS